MLLIISRNEDRPELESKILAAAFRQSVERGDVEGSRLAHRELVTLLAKRATAGSLTRDSGDHGVDMVFASDNVRDMDLDGLQRAASLEVTPDPVSFAENSPGVLAADEVSVPTNPQTDTAKHKNFDFGDVKSGGNGSHLKDTVNRLVDLANSRSSRQAGTSPPQNSQQVPGAGTDLGAAGATHDFGPNGDFAGSLSQDSLSAAAGDAGVENFAPGSIAENDAKFVPQDHVATVEEIEPSEMVEDFEPGMKAEELEPVVKAEELEPVVKAEELEPVVKAEELEP
ncbi:MAG: hypothetical protein K2X77_30305, partial [Candidatus Obscuribacterales bacterium]|nr:hypothetical protein [Candidatus Obscuribacterales bacterium]